MEKLKAFDGSFIRVITGALASCLAIVVFGLMISTTPAYINGPLILIFYLGVLWISIRFALPQKDRVALGKFGRRFKLIS
jgi:hypothetical protein